MQTTREGFFSKIDIFEEIMRRDENTTFDHLTFVGDGEPTLNRDLGWLIRRCKSRVHHPIVIITNGSLLFQRDVREDLLEADIVMPTLDAGNEIMFRKVNRPHGNIAFMDMLQGQIDFRTEYSGQIWLEVMLVKGLNDTDEELLSLANAVGDIKPDRVYIATPIRPPTEPWVEQPDVTTVLKAQKMIGGAVTMTEPESGDFDTSEFLNAREAIIEIGSRHPLRLNQATMIARGFSEAGIVRQMVENLELIHIAYDGREYVIPGHFIRGTRTGTGT